MSRSRSAGWECGRRRPIGDRLETPATRIWMLARPRVTREGVDYVDVSVSKTFALSAWRRGWLALMAESVVATRQRRKSGSRARFFCSTGTVSRPSDDWDRQLRSHERESMNGADVLRFVDALHRDRNIDKGI